MSKFDESKHHEEGCEDLSCTLVSYATKDKGKKHLTEALVKMVLMH